ncbi:IS3 family transposase [Rouxiella sp. T17]
MVTVTATQLQKVFFQLLKQEWIKKRSTKREEARSDIFDYIEIFYNSKCWLGSSGRMPATEYEKQYYQRLRST